MALVDKDPDLNKMRNDSGKLQTSKALQLTGVAFSMRDYHAIGPGFDSLRVIANPPDTCASGMEPKNGRSTLNFVRSGNETWKTGMYHMNRICAFLNGVCIISPLGIATTFLFTECVTRKTGQAIREGFLDFCGTVGIPKKMSNRFGDRIPKQKARFEKLTKKFYTDSVMYISRPGRTITKGWQVVRSYFRCLLLLVLVEHVSALGRRLQLERLQNFIVMETVSKLDSKEAGVENKKDLRNVSGSDGESPISSLVNETELFICDSCDFTATGLNQLNRHKRVHSEKLFQCDQCDHRTNLMGNLKIHKMRHSGEKPFLCDECDYRASDRNTLNRHKMRHSGEKPFECDQCDYSATRMSTLRRHMMRHSGEKPYLCDECDYKSVGMQELKKHKMVHSGERPFLCDQCDYGTARLNNLYRHKRAHSDVRPYACDRCDYRATHACALRAHMTAHSGERPYVCDRCDYRAARIRNLKVHMRRHPTE
ncbi:hypothetical protein AAG570_007230 [Ranatra chinensis]|uniref:C2H2-type domain-containing protein n=1 Tax=Ranatra chinensis TaxID=642074 RepID=A0ABD0YH35_9HEMI